MFHASMKKALGVLVVVTLAGGTADAQSPGDGGRIDIRRFHEELRRQFLAEASVVPPTREARQVSRNELSVDGSISWEGAPLRRVIHVDCNSGESIQRALRRRARELVIEIEGICVENVEVRRDRVTLIGADPEVDGIQAAGNVDPQESALLIRDARHVRIENLQLTGASWNGLRIINATDGIVVVNVLLEGNRARGADVIGSTVRFEDVVVTGNGDDTTFGLNGVVVFRAGRFTCVRCTIEDNPVAGLGLAVLSSDGSFVFFEDSAVEGQIGLVSQLGSHIQMTDSTITAVAIAASTGFNASGSVRDTTVSGSLEVGASSELRVEGVTGLGPPGPNPSVAVDNGFLIVTDGDSGPSTLVGPVLVDGFSNALIQNGTIVEELICSRAGDAYCDGTVTPGSSNCASCP